MKFKKLISFISLLLPCVFYTNICNAVVIKDNITIDTDVEGIVLYSIPVTTITTPTSEEKTASIISYSKLNVHAYSDIQGNLESDTQGEGIFFDSHSTSSWKVDIQNESPVEANYGLNFNVKGGFLYAGFENAFGSYLGVPNFNVTSGYEISILLDGTEVWGSSVSLTAKNGSFTISNISLYGTELADFSNAFKSGNYSDYGFSGPYQRFFSYEWDPREFFLNIGNFAPGENFTLEYIMKTWLEYEGTDNEIGFILRDLGYDPLQVAIAGASISDPLIINGQPVTSVITSLVRTPVQNSVPEPNTLSLILCAIIAFGLIKMFCYSSHSTQYNRGSL